MARVTVAVNVRDLTRGDLQRLRSQFSGLANSMRRFAGSNSQANLTQMRNRFAEASAELQTLRGRIPDAEFQRLNAQVRAFGVNIARATGPTTTAQFDAMRNSLRNIGRELDQFDSRGRQAGVMRVVVRDDTAFGLRQVSRSVGRFITGPLRGLMGAISGTLSDGIGQGIVGAFRSPAFGALLVAAILGAISLVGAAIAGALVLAIGGAFVGLGVFIAQSAEDVRKKWADTLNGLKPIFRDAAAGMLPVIEHARQKFDEIAREFAPHFKEAMDAAAPHLQTFIDKTKEGLRKLGEGAWDDLQTAFRVFLDAFGPEWEGFLANMGESLGALARTVSEHSTEIAAALGMVLEVINFIIDTVNFFANVWTGSINIVLGAVQMLISVIVFLGDAVLGVVQTIIEGFAEAFSSVPVIGEQLKQAAANFGTFRDVAVEKLRNIGTQAEEMGATLDRNNKVRRLEVDIASWTSQLNRAKEDLKSVPPEKKSDLLANIADLERKITAAKGQLKSIQDEVVYLTVIRRQQNFGPPPQGGQAQAHGGVTGFGRAATGGARNNMTLVGEQGPELVNLAPGSHVRSNSDSRRLVAQGQGGGGGSTLVLKSSGRRVDDLLIEILRDAIHQRGGDPVTVLGGTR